MNLVYGVDCPGVDDLKTGDLLLPKKLVSSDDENTFPYVWQGFTEQSLSDVTVRDVYQKVFQINQWSELDWDSLRANGVGRVELSRRMEVSQTAEGLWRSTQHQQVNFEDPRVMYFLLQVMRVALPDLLESWMGTSVRDFLKSSLGKILFTLLKSDDPAGQNVFIGHVGMVIREANGVVTTDATGTPYVIEANATDFSHYRVAIHPYWVDEGADTPSTCLRGWAKRRLAIGNQVWLARSDRSIPPEAPGLLVDAAKRWLGRPYGLLDSSVFADPDRMYCSEYIYRVFNDALGYPLGQANRTWGWFVNHLIKSGQTDLAEAAKEVQTQAGYVDDHEFFLLTPAMVWLDGSMTHKWCPPSGGGGPYA